MTPEQHAHAIEFWACHDRGPRGEDLRAAAAFLRALGERISRAPLALMDTRTALGVCAIDEADFPSLYALQGKRVRLVVEAVVNEESTV
jgi:hypothetical protein